MRTEHLNDKQIQTYVFDKANCEKAIIDHISSCDDCKSLVDGYQSLSLALKELPEPNLDYNLADRVLTKLPQATQKRSSNYTTAAALVVLSLGVMAVVIHAVKIDMFNLSNTENFNIYFTLSIGLFSAILWSLDIIKSYHKKITTINHL